MPETIQDSIRRLLRYRRTPRRVTSAFRNWKHNKDILPRLQTQLEMVLDSYGKFEPIVYDTQGIHDDGTDLVLRCKQVGSDRSPDVICFQAKSFDDLSKKRYLQELKAQRDDSFRKVMGLTWYFVVLCTDAVAHENKVRQITAEFRSADRTEVVVPEFAYTFLLHPKARVEALVTRSMEAGDFVFKSALESLDDLISPSARALIIFMTVRWVSVGDQSFSVDDLLRNAYLRSVYRELQEKQDAVTVNERDPEDEPYRLFDFEEQLAEDLAILGNDFCGFDEKKGELQLEPSRLRALVGLVADSSARYEHKNGQLLEYMFNLMGVRD